MCSLWNNLEIQHFCQMWDNTGATATGCCISLFSIEFNICTHQTTQKPIMMSQSILNELRLREEVLYIDIPPNSLFLERMNPSSAFFQEQSLSHSLFILNMWLCYCLPTLAHRQLFSEKCRVAVSRELLYFDLSFFCEVEVYSYELR